MVLKECKYCHILKEEQENYYYNRINNCYAIECKECKKKFDKLRAVAPAAKIISEKCCNKCQIIKSINDFRKDKYSTDKHSTICKECFNISHKTNEYKEWAAKYRDKNRSKIRSQAVKFRQRRKISNPNFKLQNRVRVAISRRIKRNGGVGAGSFLNNVMKYLPYTIEDLKIHIETQFEPWMNWNNWGVYNKDHLTWQIDHIIPQSLLPFDSLTHSNFLKCWSLENLRPLETIANIKKYNRIISNI